MGKHFNNFGLDGLKTEMPQSVEAPCGKSVTEQKRESLPISVEYCEPRVWDSQAELQGNSWTTCKKLKNTNNGYETLH